MSKLVQVSCIWKWSTVLTIVIHHFLRDALDLGLIVPLRVTLGTQWCTMAFTPIPRSGMGTVGHPTTCSWPSSSPSEPVWSSAFSVCYSGMHCLLPDSKVFLDLGKIQETQKSPRNQFLCNVDFLLLSGHSLSYNLKYKFEQWKRGFQTDQFL